MDEFMRLVLSKLDEMGIKIEQMESRIEQLDAKIDKMETRINDRIDGMDARLNAKIDEMDARLSAKIDEIDKRTQRMDTRLSRLEITVEQDLSRKIDVIGEGHDFLTRGVEEARKMESAKERMNLQIINLEMDVKKIKQHLSMA